MFRRKSQRMSESVITPNRCFNCKKKMGLLGIECKCKHTFCTSCRYAEKHGCSFDYFNTEREKLRRENPKICAVKVEKV
jgi:hypothetical protein